MANDSMTPAPRRDRVGDAAAVAIAAMPALTSVVLGLSHAAASVALAAGPGVAGAVAVRNALGSRTLRRRIDALELAAAESPLVRARVAALEEHVADVAREALARGATADELREAFQRPDIAFLLAMARDNYAVATMKERLRRHAAIAAGRVHAAADAPFDKALVFARAALDLEDIGVAFLRHVVALADLGQSCIRSAVPAVEKDTHDGEVRIAHFLAAQHWSDRTEVDGAVAAIDGLIRRGLAFQGGPRGHDGFGAVEVDGHVARFLNYSAAPTDLGRDFVAEIRRAGDDHVPGPS